MSKAFIALALLFTFSLALLPGVVLAAGACSNGWVTCNGVDKPCTWDKVFETLGCILDFIVTGIAVPLAVLAIIVGAVVWMTSAGNPGRVSLGKSIVFWAIGGLLLALCTKLIINFVLEAIGADSYKI